MQFFKSKPNLPDGEKARIEFHLQQIGECIGFERLSLPVMNEVSILNGDGQSELRSPKQIKELVGERLGHDVSGLSVQSFPMQPAKSGGGG